MLMCLSEVCLRRHLLVQESCLELSFLTSSPESGTEIDSGSKIRKMGELILYTGIYMSKCVSGGYHHIWLKRGFPATHSNFAWCKFVCYTFQIANSKNVHQTVPVTDQV